MKYAVIGTGWITESFIGGAEKAGGAELFGVCSRSYSKGKTLAEKFGAPRVFVDLKDLARCPDVEAVYIASPNSLHYEQSKLMLSNGKHVICEKPITVTPEQLDELQTLADKNGLIYMEAMMYLHSPVRPKIKNALPGLGSVTSAHFDFSQLSSKLPAYKRGENPNIFNPAFATGSLMDLGVYCVYPAVDLFGMPDKISAFAGFIPGGSDGTGCAVLEYGDKLVTLTWSKLAQSFAPSQILGDGGTLTIESLSQLTGITFCRKGEGERRLVGDTDRHTVMSYEMKDFISYINDPAGTKADYDCCRETAMKVSEIMARIRETAGIKFSGDN